MKKICLFFIFSVCFIFSGENCPFCNREIVEYQKYFEDDLVMGLCTHKPVVEGHCLIIPKRHVERFEDLTPEEELAVNSLIKKTQKAAFNYLNKNSYLLLQKNGRSVGQTVPHVHFHFIPRKEDESPSFMFLLKFFTSSYFSPISSEEMAKVTTGFVNNLE